MYFNEICFGVRRKLLLPIELKSAGSKGVLPPTPALSRSWAHSMKHLQYTRANIDASSVELERAQIYRASGIDGLSISGSGRARVSHICSQARRALKAKDKVMLILVNVPNWL